MGLINARGRFVLGKSHVEAAAVTVISLGEGTPGGGYLWDLFFTSELSPSRYKLLYGGVP